VALEPLGRNGVVGFARGDEQLLWTTKYTPETFWSCPHVNYSKATSSFHWRRQSIAVQAALQSLGRQRVTRYQHHSDVTMNSLPCHFVASWRLNYALEHIIHTSTLVTVFTVRLDEHNCIVIIIISKYSGLDDKCVFQPIAVESLGPLNETACHFLKDLGRRISAQSGDERECLPVPKVICCHSAIQRYLAPPQFWGGRPPGLMVIPAFTFSNHFFLALGIGDALGTEK